MRSARWDWAIQIIWMTTTVRLRACVSKTNVGEMGRERMELYGIIVNRFAMLYAPPHLFGSFSGVQFSFISVGMLLGVTAMSAILDAAATTSVLKYQVPYVALSLGSAALGFCLVEFWRRVPPPPIGGILEH